MAKPAEDTGKQTAGSSSLRLLKRDVLSFPSPLLFYKHLLSQIIPNNSQAVCSPITADTIKPGDTEKNTMCKTQVWGRESRGQRVCGKPKFHALWKPKSRVPSLKISTKRLTRAKRRNQSSSFSRIKRIKLNLNVAVSPVGAGHLQTHVTS